MWESGATIPSIDNLVLFGKLFEAVEGNNGLCSQYTYKRDGQMLFCRL